MISHCQCIPHIQIYKSEYTKFQFSLKLDTSVTTSKRVSIDTRKQRFKQNDIFKTCSNVK